MFKLNQSKSSRLRIEEMLDAYKHANEYRYTDKPKYTAILNEYFKKEALRRIELFRKIEKNPELQVQVMLHISKRENIADFMCDWCWTYDPRLSAMGLPTILPWIPFPRQLEFIEWFFDHYLQQKGGIIEKSRDMGITWVFVLLCVFEWRFTQGFAGGIGSNKLDNVDKRDEPDSIFEKMRKLIKLLPKFWLPPEFDWTKHDKVGNLVNPYMNSQIGGQGGKDIGRGGRRSFYLVDEAASLEFPMHADMALSNNTNCQFDLSTPRGMNHFGQKRHSGKVDVFTFHWKDDPRKNEEWYEEQKQKLDPVVLAQELEINYHASVAGLFIKPEWVRAAVDIKLKPAGTRAAGLDVAAGGTNKSSVALRYGPVALVKAYDIENGTELTHMAIDLCNEADMEFLNYDAIGVGHAVTSVIERTEKKMNFAHFGIKVGGKPSDLFYDEFDKYAKDVFINLRAEIWYILSIRFKKTWEHVNGIRNYADEELISIENDGNLIAQLSSVKRLDTEAGKIKAESKDAMIKRGIQSPDEADSLGLAFLPRAGGVKRIMAGMDGVEAKKIEINWELPSFKIKHYGAIVIDKDLSVHFMAAVWDEESAELKIYADTKFDYPDADLITDVIVSKMNLTRYSYDRMLGNKVMFEDHKRTFHREINKRFWDKVSFLQTVVVRRPTKYDELGSVAQLTNLVNTGRLKIDLSCKETAKQMRMWKLENQTFKHSGMQECILLIISELMLYAPFQQSVPKKPEYLPAMQEWDDPSKQGPMEV
jgi:hypothetical protein